VAILYTILTLTLTLTLGLILDTALICSALLPSYGYFCYYCIFLFIYVLSIILANKDDQNNILSVR